MKKIDGDTLGRFSLKELQKICKYYGIEYLPSWSKAKLKKEILAYSPETLIAKTYPHKYIDTFDYSQFAVVELIKPEIIKSARIQRIEEGKEK